METKEMTCINCPMGCQLTVTIDGNDIKVTGNTCPRGEAYAKDEVTHPTRIVTSSIPVSNGERVSCKTKMPIPKEKIFDIMKVIKKTKVNNKSFSKQVREELKKVKWPSKKEMMKYSVSCILFVLVFGIYFYGLDALFAWISSLVKGL